MPAGRGFRLRLPGPAAAAVAWAATRPAAADPPSGVSYQCKDPLFRGHWHVERINVGTLTRVPVAYTDLSLCKMWNYHSSCCSSSMEAPQRQAFRSRRKQLERRVALMKIYQGDLTTLRGSLVYRRSELLEQALFDRAVDALGVALDRAPRCVEALMVFAAGMICFGCNPRWYDFVWRDAGGAVTRVNIAGDSCIWVATKCGPFGRAVQDFYQQLAQSGLAKTPRKPLPDWSMLFDREAMCDWLRWTLAMQPLPSFVLGWPYDGPRRLGDGSSARNGSAGAGAGSAGVGNATAAKRARSSAAAPPSNKTKEIKWFEPPPLSPVEARATAQPPTTAVPTAPGWATEPTAALDPVVDGRRSGFGLRLDILGDRPETLDDALSKQDWFGRLLTSTAASTCHPASAGRLLAWLGAGAAAAVVG